MRFLKFLFTLILLTIVAAIAAFFLFRETILGKIESAVIERIETATNTTLEYQDLSYLPITGVCFTELTVYDRTLPGKVILSAEKLTAFMDLPRFIDDKSLALRLGFTDLKKDAYRASGVITAESEPPSDGKFSMKSVALKKIGLAGVDISGAVVSLEDISGTINISPEAIMTRDMSFDYGGASYLANVTAKDYKKFPAVDIEIKNRDVSVLAALKKTDEDIKISGLEATFGNTRLSCSGRFSGADSPFLALSGSLKLSLEDLASININDGMKKAFRDLRIRGNVANDFSFEGNLKEQNSWIATLKSRSALVNVANFKMTNASFTLNVEDNMRNIPLLEADFYGGKLRSTIAVTLFKNDFFYKVRLVFSRVDINKLIRDTTIETRDLTGFITSETNIEGNFSDQASMRGRGFITASEANLGLMPLISPLLGNIYNDILSPSMPDLKKIEITSASCAFQIRDRKIETDNILFSGDILNIYGSGYIDFDKNLDIDFENEFKAESPDPTQDEQDWRNDLVTLIAGFGKAIGSAKLTGTLDKPVWKYNFLSGIKRALSSMFRKI